jgi:hypothetical protein
MGVDYSASFMAKPAFARLFGLMFVLVGLFSFSASSLLHERFRGLEGGAV